MPVLYISAVAGGARVNTEWERAVTRLMRVAKGRGFKYTSPLRVGIKFEIPGEVRRAAFTGVRAARFDDQEVILEIRAGLPDKPADNAAYELHILLYQAVELAEAFARQRGIAESLPALWSLIGELQDSGESSG